MLDYTANLLCHFLLGKEWGECWKPLPDDFPWMEAVVSFLGPFLVCGAAFPIALWFNRRFFTKPSRNVVLTTSYGCIVCYFSFAVVVFMHLYGDDYLAPSMTLLIPSSMVGLVLLVSYDASPLTGYNMSRSTKKSIIISFFLCLAILLTILQFYPQKVFPECNLFRLSLIAVLIGFSAAFFAACIYFIISFFEFWTAEKLYIWTRDGEKTGYLVKKEGKWIECKLDGSGVEQQGFIL